MQLPENIVQIGIPDDFYKVYIEDYVHTYIKQYENGQTNSRIRIYLFGRALSGEQTGYFYIYGAANSEKGILSTQHEFFPDYDIIGVLSIYQGEKEIALQNGTAFLLEGYFVFYEQNEAMQEFLIHNYREKEEDTGSAGKEENHTRHQPPPKAYNEPPGQSHVYRQPQQRGQAGNLLYMAAGSLAVVICIIAITTINRYDELQGFNEHVLQAVNDDFQESIYIEEIREDVSQEAEQDDLSVTESQEFLSEEAIFEENRNAMGETENTENTEKTSEQETLEQKEETSEPPKELAVQAPAESSPTIYVVKKGDTLMGICKNYYGDDKKVKQVCQENQIENPDDIFQGQKLVLP